jgi:hypothetical protein
MLRRHGREPAACLPSPSGITSMKVRSRRSSSSSDSTSARQDESQPKIAPPVANPAKPNIRVLFYSRSGTGLILDSRADQAYTSFAVSLGDSMRGKAAGSRSPLTLEIKGFGQQAFVVSCSR